MRHLEPLGGEVFIVGTCRRIRLLDVVVALNRNFGTDLETEFQSARPGDVRDSLASLDAIGRGLGYRRLVRLWEGLRHTVEANR